MKIVSIFFGLIAAVSLAMVGCSPKGFLSMKPEEYANYALHRYGAEVSAWWPRPVARSATEERIIAEYGPEKEDFISTSDIEGVDSTRSRVLMRVIDGDTSPEKYWEWFPGKIVEIELPSPRYISKVVVHTVKEPLGGFALEGYYVKCYEESGGIGGWKLLASAGRAKSTRMEHSFYPVKTDKIRLEMSHRGDAVRSTSDREHGARIAIYAKLVEVELLGVKPQDFDERKLMAEASKVRRKTPEMERVDTYGIFFPVKGDTVKTYRGGYMFLSPAVLDTLKDIKMIDIPGRDMAVDPEAFSFSCQDGSMDMYDIDLGTYTSGRWEIDITDASSSLDSGDLVVTMKVRSRIVSSIAGSVSKGYDYGFKADFDSDGDADFEAHYMVCSSHPEVWGEISDDAGKRYSILEGLSTYIRGNLLEMRIPLEVLPWFHDIESFRPEVFAQFQNFIDVCPDANLEARYRRDLRSR